MLAPGGVAEEVDVVADALRGVAVVADAVGLTGRLDVEPGCIDGRRRAPCTCQSGFDGLGHLVQADDEDDRFGPQVMAATRLPLPSMLTMTPSSEMALALER